MIRRLLVVLVSVSALGDPVAAQTAEAPALMRPTAYSSCWRPRSATEVMPK